MVRNRRLTRAAAVVVAASVLSVWTPTALTGLGLAPAGVAYAAPVVPAGFRVDVGNGKIFPSWTTNTDSVLSYEVRLVPYGPLGALLGQATTTTVLAPATTTTISGLTNGANYDVSVRAVYSPTVKSTYSAVTTVRPTATTPAQPTGLSATAGDSRVTLGWAAGTDTTRKRIDVYRDGVAIAWVTAPTATFIDTTAVNGTLYKYEIGAVNDASSPHVRSELSVAQSATPLDRTPPAPPQNVAATPGDRSAALSWAANPEPDLGHYRVVGPGVDVQVPTSAWSTTGLTNGTTYTYTVTAVDKAGNASTGTTVTVRPVDLVAPDVPTALVVRSADSALDVSWTASAAPDRSVYRVYVDGALFATVPASTTSVRLDPLTNGTSYAVRISAVDAAANESARTAAVTGTPRDTTPPTAPTGVLGVTGDRQATLSWNANPEPDVDHYLLLASTGAQPVRVDGTTTTITGLVNDVPVTYSVAAVDRAGNVSPHSASVLVMPRDTTPPSAPTGVLAVAGDASAVLSWTASPEADVDHYDVRDPDGHVLATVPAPATTVTLTGLANGVAARFVVVAVDRTGNLSPASVTVTATPRDSTPPRPPTQVMGVSDDGRGSVVWTPSPDRDVVGYVVRDAAGTVVATVDAETTWASITGLVNGSTYTYTVTAVDAAGNPSVLSTSVTLAPHDTTAPTAPSSATAVAGDASVLVSWTPSPQPDVDRYLVVDQNGTVRASAPRTATSTTVTGLANGTTYTFSVIAVDAAGNRSAATAAGPATPARIPLAVPTGVGGTAGDGAVSISWTGVADARVTGYEVCTTSGLCEPIAAGVVAAGFLGLTNGTAYTFVVRALDALGNRSAASAAVTLTPHPTAAAAPTGVVAVAGDASVVLTWNPVDGASTYEVLTSDGRTLPATGTSLTLTGLTNGTSYSLRVRALAVDGTRGALSVAVAVTPAAASTAPPAAGAGTGAGPAVSRDGRYAVFATAARLEAGDTNALPELYVRDATTGTSVRLDASAAGSDLATSQTAVSGDGRYLSVVTALSRSAADVNTLPDVYLVDLASRTWRLVSSPVSGAGSATAGTVKQPGVRTYASGPSVAMTDDASTVFFFSDRTDLVAGDTNKATDLFAKDLATGAVTRVSTTATGAQLPYGVQGPAVDVSPDGRYAVFAAKSVNVVMAWRKDLRTGALEAVSGTGAWPASGTAHAVGNDARDLSVSDDGRFVGFSSSSTVLTKGSTEYLAYRRDMSVPGRIVRAGVVAQTSVWEQQVTLDASGRYAFFATTANYGADKDGRIDWYRYDVDSGALVQVTTTATGGVPATRLSGNVTVAEFGAISVLSPDVVVVATMQALVPADTNKLTDVYRKVISSGAVGSAA